MGEGKAAHDFAKQFLERRQKLKPPSQVREREKERVKRVKREREREREGVRVRERED